jgi:S1-C subfamily serine protease
MADTSQEEVSRVGALLNARRPASLKGWQDKSIGDENVRSYLLARTALLVPPGMKMTVRYRDTTDKVRRYDARFSGRGTAFFAGSAVPVTPDGYFLTASHCLEEAVPGVVAITRGGGLQSAASRIVWRGRESDGEPDLALLHAPLAPAASLTLTGLPGPEIGSMLFTAGFGSNGVPGIKAGISGGHVARLGAIHDRPAGAHWREIAHHAPTAWGDSGGPVIDESGRLLGITIELRGWRLFAKHSSLVWFYRGIAICPDAGWIQSLIDKDRAASRGKAVR